jgi:hypothetical protein
MSVTIENALCTGETDKAIKVRLEDGEEMWFPKSQVEDDSEVYKKGTDGLLVISDWIAENKGIT